MKRQILVGLGSLMLLSAAVTFGEPLKRVMDAEIPFAFHVGNTILPAGHYQVTPEMVPGILSIRGEKHNVVVITSGVEANQVRSKSSLLFMRYGDTYFLSKVWLSGQSLGRALPQTNAERELARATAHPSPQLVVAQR
jgi:hypothetical protein